MNSNLIKISILTIVLSIIFINPISATSAGVSPPKILINDALPGEAYNLSFAVYNQGNQSTDYSIEVKGNISNWTYIEKRNISLEANSNYPVSGLITVPSNTLSGSYTGSVLIKSIPGALVSGNKVSVGVNLPVVINVTSKSDSTEKLSSNSTNTTFPAKTPGFEVLFTLITIILIYAKLKTIKRE